MHITCTYATICNDAPLGRLILSTLVALLANLGSLMLEINDLHTDDFLAVRFGLLTPAWTVTSDSDSVHLADADGCRCAAVPVDPNSISQIRKLHDGVGCVVCKVNISGRSLTLYLYGKKVCEHTWQGVAASHRNFDFAHDIAQLVQPEVPRKVVNIRDV